MTKADKIRRFLDKGQSSKEIAKKLKVSPTYINYVKRKDASESRKEVMKRTMPKIEAEVRDVKAALDFLEDDVDLIIETREFTDEEMAALDKEWIEFANNAPDLVNHPPHYKAGGIETIDFIEAKDLNFRLGNVVKYVARAEKKGNPLEDLKKAKWYLDREIAVRERA